MSSNHAILRLGRVPIIIFLNLYVLCIALFSWIEMTGKGYGLDNFTAIGLFLLNIFYLYFLYALTRLGHEIVDSTWVYNGVRGRMFLTQDRIPLSHIVSLKRGVGMMIRPFEAIFVEYDDRGSRRSFPIVLEAYSRSNLRTFLDALHQKRPDLNIPEY